MSSHSVLFAIIRTPLGLEESVFSIANRIRITHSKAELERAILWLADRGRLSLYHEERLILQMVAEQWKSPNMYLLDLETERKDYYLSVAKAPLEDLTQYMMVPHFIRLPMLNCTDVNLTRLSMDATPSFLSGIPGSTTGLYYAALLRNGATLRKI